MLAEDSEFYQWLRAALILFLWLKYYNYMFFLFKSIVISLLDSTCGPLTQLYQ